MASWWPLGSSARRRRGRSTSARASAVRCCCPTDVSLGARRSSSSSPSAPSKVSTRSRAESNDPWRRAGYSMFSRTVSSSMSPNFCGRTAISCQRRSASRAPGSPLPDDRPGIGTLPAREHVQERRLSGARPAHQPDHPTRLEPERDLVQSVHLLGPAPVRLREAVDLHDRTRRRRPGRASASLDHDALLRSERVQLHPAVVELDDVVGHPRDAGDRASRSRRPRRARTGPG